MILELIEEHIVVPLKISYRERKLALLNDYICLNWSGCNIGQVNDFMTFNESISTIESANGSLQWRKN